LASRLPALFSQIEHLTDAVKGANAGGTSHLRIGDGGALTTEVIAPALRRLRQEWPNLRLSSVQNTSEGFFQDLLENRIDCAFPALELKGNELISHKLCRLEIGLVLPPGHRLAGRSEIRFERLRNERWILPPRDANPVLYDELISCCHKAGFTPDVIAEWKTRLAREQKLEQWVFLVSDWSLAPLLKARTDFVKKAEPSPTPQASASTPAASPTPASPVPTDTPRVYPSPSPDATATASPNKKNE
jgi:DNA-binding transcriptional LysR family regulator